MPLVRLGPLFALLLLSLLLMMFNRLAGASPHESANPWALPPEGNLIQITPPARFSVDDRMSKNVDFWVQVYTKYSTGQGLIHDAKYIDLVYEVVDLRELAQMARGEPQNSRLIRSAKKKWKDILFSVHRKQQNPETMNPEERRVFEMYRGINEPNKFINAAHRKRLRFQLGQKDQFLDGLIQSGRFLPIMEEIFDREGLPKELTRLPFVESSFNVRARSKVGASGIWQFMRSTGKLFLKINDAVDERNDPVRATEAAAKLLKLNYESLRKWPLAVTAYNHGRKGMMRAVRLTGTDDLEDLVGSYRSRTFGFASSNFFCELLAAIEVERNAEKYFGKIKRDPLLRYVEAKIPDYIGLHDLSEFLKLDVQDLKALNPGLSDFVFSGRRLIPAGYQLRLPFDGTLSKEAALRVFFAGYSQIPGIYKVRAQLKGSGKKRARANRPARTQIGGQQKG
ncbi:MAG TPA: lytic transglycosylase domain-containing protein [Bdellovibrionota bacterium]|nr:lytic transglycosylase domain-containing protein [Bdellovibrionota bacterium]